MDEVNAFITAQTNAGWKGPQEVSTSTSCSKQGQVSQCFIHSGLHIVSQHWLTDQLTMFSSLFTTFFLLFLPPSPFPACYFFKQHSCNLCEPHITQSFNPTMF